MRRLVRLVVLLGLVVGSVAFAATHVGAQDSRRTWWVSANGDDGDSGNRLRPLRSITAAVTRSSQGDTIRVLPGRYPEGVRIPPDRPDLTIVGSAAARLVAADDRPALWIQAAGTRVEGITISSPGHGIEVAAGPTVIDDVTIDGVGRDGIRVTAGPVDIRRSRLRNLGDYNAIRLDPAVPGLQARIARNRIDADPTRARQNGVLVGAGAVAEVTSNVIRGASGVDPAFLSAAVVVVGGASARVVDNSLLDGAAGVLVTGAGNSSIEANRVLGMSGWGIVLLPEAAGARVERNLVAGSGQSDLSWSGDLNTVRANLCLTGGPLGGCQPVA